MPQLLHTLIALSRCCCTGQTTIFFIRGVLVPKASRSGIGDKSAEHTREHNEEGNRLRCCHQGVSSIKVLLMGVRGGGGDGSVNDVEARNMEEGEGEGVAKSQGVLEVEEKATDLPRRLNEIRGRQEECIAPWISRVQQDLGVH